MLSMFKVVFWDLESPLLTETLREKSADLTGMGIHFLHTGQVISRLCLVAVDGT